MFPPVTFRGFHLYAIIGGQCPDNAARIEILKSLVAGSARWIFLHPGSTDGLKRDDITFPAYPPLLEVSPSYD